jgi:hypothetical protein
LKTSEKVYWIKVAIAVFAALACVSLQVYFRIDGALVFMLGTLIYLISSDVLSNMMKLDRGHGLKIAIGAYIFVWLMTWTLLYTIIRI